MCYRCGIQMIQLNSKRIKQLQLRQFLSFIVELTCYDHMSTWVNH